MNKKRLVSVSNSIVALGMLGMVVFYFFRPEDKNPNAIVNSQLPVSPITNGVEYSLQYAPEKDLIGGICALLIVGYLFWACYRKFQRDSQTERAVKENTLYNISLETGQNEYDLFIKSAENWSVSRHRIEEDFKRYMADQVMPHYAKDFVRKYHAQIEESLVKKREVTPVSISDWAIALLVFPGSVLFMFLLAFFMG
jgi:hypothetical protein